MEIENMITEEEYAEAGSFERGIVPAGKYKCRILGTTGSIHAAQASGQRSLVLAIAPTTNEDGASVNGKAIYHRLPIEGTFTNKKTGAAVKKVASFFAPFFKKGLDLELDDVNAVLASALEAPVSTGFGKESTPAILKLSNGEILDLENRELMASVAVEEYNGTERNKIKSVWAVDQD